MDLSAEDLDELADRNKRALQMAQTVDPLERRQLHELRDFLLLERKGYGRSTLAFHVASAAISRVDQLLAGHEHAEHVQEQKLERWNAAAREANRIGRAN